MLAAPDTAWPEPAGGGRGRLPRRKAPEHPQPPREGAWPQGSRAESRLVAAFASRTAGAEGAPAGQLSRGRPGPPRRVPFTPWSWRGRGCLESRERGELPTSKLVSGLGPPVQQQPARPPCADRGRHSQAWFLQAPLRASLAGSLAWLTAGLPLGPPGPWASPWTWGQAHPQRPLRHRAIVRNKLRKEESRFGSPLGIKKTFRHQIAIFRQMQLRGKLVFSSFHWKKVWWSV